MLKDEKIWLASSDKDIFILPQMANRHGLIAGATGTGKTTTMKVMAESFSDMGVPVFFCDVKGDLSGMCCPGAATETLVKRIESFGLEPENTFPFKSYPTRFWDIFGEKGHPVRVSVSSLGPTLLSRLLKLTEVQQGVLNVVFKVADESGLELLDFKDLRAILKYVGDNRREYTTLYGNVSAASIGAIQRSLLQFEQEGGECIFGEAELELSDWMQCAEDGRGYINILESSRLIQSPTVYSTFLLWMISDMYEKLPEMGDLDKPRMVFFFDEAHLLFDDEPRALIQKIVQVVKLIRSKGIGIYFVTQSPSDIPDEVLAQLSNKVQHALRAYTPSELKAVKAAAAAFRPNPAFSTEEKIMSLGVGEALISVLDEKGVPTVTEAARILPPQSLMGPAEDGIVEKMIAEDDFEAKYRVPIDRESAYEIINRAREELEKEEAEAFEEEEEEKPESIYTKQGKALQTSSSSGKKLVPASSSSKRRSSRRKSSGSTIENALSFGIGTAAGTVTHDVINSMSSGKRLNAKQTLDKAVQNGLSSAVRRATRDIVRGLFGNRRF
jgi:DNA helicase HerA-like ATPase